MIIPVRLHLSRKKGFNLQAVSQAINGLPAVNVARPSKWGNPFVIEKGEAFGPREVEQALFDLRRAEAVANFREHLISDLREPWERMRRELPKLRGRNLACWCAEGEKVCHAQVLIEISNGGAA